MSIEKHLEQVINSLEAERNTVINATKDKVMREKIAPYNQEIDNALACAIMEKQSALTANIATLQENFAAEKKQMAEAAERKKAENASAVITAETYAVTVEYDKEISYLKDRVNRLKQSK